MNIRDLISLCAKNLMRRKTRTILAITGVMVGTCAVVVMLSVGFGMTKSYEEQIQSYGDLHMIQLYSGGGGYAGANGQKMGEITDKTLASIEKMDGVTAVTPIVSTYMTIGIGKYVTGAEIIGIKPDVLEKFNYGLQEGRYLTSADKDAIIFGSEIPNWFYNPKSSNYDSKTQNVVTDKIILTADSNYGQKSQSGQTDDRKVEYKQYRVKGVGLLESKNDSPDYSVYMNITRVDEIMKETAKAEGQRMTSGRSTDGTRTYNQAYVYVGDINDTERLSKELKELGYQSYSPIDWLASMKETSNMIQGILGGIGGISLFVAALSITNTMIMSIYERTKEIGVMKVIGANLRDIRRQFLMEAGMIGFIGGVLGVILSLTLSLMMNTVLRDLISIALNSLGSYGTTISIIPVWLVFAAIAFATGIGVLAGYSPAKRAMNLSALESLRNE